MSTRWAWHASTAVSSVSGRTAKWRCRCHSPITTRACRWPGVSICEERAADLEHRRKAGVPDEIDFKTKPGNRARAGQSGVKAGLSRGVVLMDAGYGCNTNLRTGISALSLTYVAGILPRHGVDAPARVRCRRRNGRAAANDQCAFVATTSSKPGLTVEGSLSSLPKRSWRSIEWREGTAEPLSSRFARVRVRAAHRGLHTLGKPARRVAVDRMARR